MIKLKKIVLVLNSLCLFFCLIIITSGCKDNSIAIEDEFLLRTETAVITVGDYMKSLEIAKSAYAHSVLQKPEAFRKIQLRLFSQLAEEMIVMEVAKKKNIVITDAELKAEIDLVKKNYPDNVFNEMLLENAITYELWETMLKRRLLMDKVLAQELDLEINITPEVIEDYYKKNNLAIDTEFAEDSEKIYSRLIKRMRLEKKQKSYQAWIEEKKKYYSIEVNEKVWGKITGS